MAAVIEAWKINQKFVTLKFNMKMAGKLHKRLGEGKPVVGKKPVIVSSKWLMVSGLSTVVRRLSFLTVFTLCLTAFSFHPYYMSVTEFVYNPAEKEVQVSCKIFTDDLEETLRLALKRKVDLLNTSAKKENEQ